MASRSNSSTTTRKRTRAQNEEEPSSTASKRPRLKSANGPLASSASSQKANPSSAADGASGRRRRVPAAKDTPAADPRAAQDSAGEGRPRNDRAKTQPKKSQSQTQATSQKRSVYDVPDSDEDELGAPGVTPHPPRQKAGAAAVATAAADAAAPTKGDEPAKKKRGRPKKRDREAQRQAQNDVVPAARTSTTSPTPAPRAGRSSGGGDPPRESRLPEVKETDGETAPSDLAAPRARRQRGAANSRVGESARLPKGILTPRKEKGGRDRRHKSVTFDSQPDEEALEQLEAQTPSRSTTRKARQATAREEGVAGEAERDGKAEADERTPDEGSTGGDEEDDDDDDEVCAMCGKPDSEPPNEIVFCDGCDMPVHQECYGLAEIPEGDWICRNCSQEEAAGPAGQGGASRATSAAAAQEGPTPDIANFDLHLRAMQRVLLDRCAGRRRIKLRGQDEAYRKASKLVEQTVVAGEGNSMVIIGARGCGKTTVSRRVALFGIYERAKWYIVVVAGRVYHLGHAETARRSVPCRQAKRLHPHGR